MRKYPTTHAELQRDVERLQKEYAACDDFPTARHEIARDLEETRARLARTPALSGEVAQAPLAEKPESEIRRVHETITQLERTLAISDGFPSARHEINAQLIVERAKLRELLAEVGAGDIPTPAP